MFVAYSPKSMYATPSHILSLSDAPTLHGGMFS